MITEEQKAESAAKRIQILREGFPDDPEVLAWDLEHPAEVQIVESTDRLTAEEVAVADETARTSLRGKIGGRKPTEDLP